MALQFRAEDRGRVASGEISLTFRLWKSAHVKAGRSYSTGFGDVFIDDVQLLPAALIGEDDVRLAGCRDLAEVWRSAGEHRRAEIGPDTLLYRIKFRFLHSG